LTRVQTDAGRI